MSRRAVILAGGKGTRLKPYTITFPKPLVPIIDMPILEIVIKQLAHYGFNHITMAVNHLADLIMAFFGDGQKWGIKIDYSLENKPLSTMGPLTLIKDLPENFLVMNGDLLTNLNFEEFFKKHEKNGSIFSISSYKRVQKVDYGVLELNDSSQLIGFTEKPELNYNVSMGIYMVNKKTLDFIPKNQSYGFDNLMKDLIESQKTVNVELFDGIWLDIGRPDDYSQAIEIYEKNKEKFLPGEIE